MSRPRILTDDLILDRALAVFWQRGYAATSLRDLTRVTGLSASALYNRFADKDQLFVEALRRYADQGLRERLVRLAAMPDPLAAIKIFFDELVAASVDDPDRRGCLLVNTALDGGAIAPAARAIVRERLGEVEAFFGSQLARARQAGRLAADIDPATQAEALLGTVLAIRVLARLDPDAARLHRLVTRALAPMTERSNRSAA